MVVLIAAKVFSKYMATPSPARLRDGVAVRAQAAIAVRPPTGGPRDHRPTCRRIFSAIAWSRISAISRMSPPHRGQIETSTANARCISSPHCRRRAHVGSSGPATWAGSSSRSRGSTVVRAWARGRSAVQQARSSRAEWSGVDIVPVVGPRCENPRT